MDGVRVPAHSPAFQGGFTYKTSVNLTHMNGSLFLILKGELVRGVIDFDNSWMIG